MAINFSNFHTVCPSRSKNARDSQYTAGDLTADIFLIVLKILVQIIAWALNFY